jgi:queuine tRNA-ribosyltransferase
LRTVTENGVEFRSHIDGSRRLFTPESVMAIEQALGADVIMQFDHVIPGQSDVAAARDAAERSVRWLERCRVAFGDSTTQALFPVLQGGTDVDLRLEIARRVMDAGDWRGFGIGGLSVGEAKDDMYRVMDATGRALPKDRPRYLMGVGFPEDLLQGIVRGVDMFDCVAPTRMGRNGTAFTRDGRLNVRNASLREDEGPIDATCDCTTCRRFSRAYVRHLFVAEEMLGPRLLSLHNVHFLISLARQAREAVVAGTISRFAVDWIHRYEQPRI